MISREERTVDVVYNKYASTYGSDIKPTFPNRIKYELAIKYLQPDFDVLDVGCANALHMQLLAQHCKCIAGIDINDKMLAVASEKLNERRVFNAELYKQSASHLEFDDESFDLAYSFSTLLLVPDTQAAIREIARVLRAGGIAILDITGKYNISRVYWGWYYRHHGHFGVNSFAFSEISVILDDLGMEILERHALGFTDQWHYIPGVHMMKFLDGFFHGTTSGADRDYQISNKPYLFPFANRWYIVCRKRA